MKPNSSLFNTLRTFLFKKETIVIILFLASFLFLYRDVFLKNKIAFPSNFLTTFYSPWATHRYPEYPNGIPYKPIGGNDQARMFYPYRTFINESLKKGELPLWNPYNFSGSPLLANFQSAVFYPLNLLYLVLPQITAWTLLVMLQPLFGTWFMYLYLRALNLQKSSSFFGAIAFGFSGYIVTWSQENAVVGQSAIWLPLILLFTEKYLATFKIKYYIYLVLTLTTCIFAGHLQTTFSIFVITFIYALTKTNFNQEGEKPRTFLIIISSYIWAILFSAIQLIPSIEAFKESARSSTSSISVVQNYLLPATHFIRALAPDIFGTPGSFNYFGPGYYHEMIFYVGIIPLLFVPLAITQWRKNIPTTYFTMVALVSYILTINSPLAILFYKLPLISTFTPSRLLFITAPALAILSAHGVDIYTENKKKNTKKIIWNTALVYIIVFILITRLFNAVMQNPQASIRQITNYISQSTEVISKQNFSILLRNIIPAVIMISIAVIGLLLPRRVFIVVIIALTVCGQLYFYNKYLVLGEKKFLYPSHFIWNDIKQNTKYERFLSFGLPILGDVGLQEKVFSPDGIDPVFPSRYGQLVYATKRQGAFTTDIPRIEVNLSEYADNYNIENNTQRQRLINLLGVSRIYNYQKAYNTIDRFPKIFPATQYTSLWQKEDWQAYQNTQAYPRAFLVNDFIVKKNNKEIIDQILNSDINLKKTVVLEEKPTQNISNKQALESEAQITSYQNSKVEIKTTTNQTSILFLSDNFYQGWKATIDNQKTKILRADYTFRAVVVPAGKHTIIYTFEPQSVFLGKIISLLAIIFFVPFCFYVHKKINNQLQSNSSKTA